MRTRRSSWTRLSGIVSTISMPRATPVRRRRVVPTRGRAPAPPRARRDDGVVSSDSRCRGRARRQVEISLDDVIPPCHDSDEGAPALDDWSERVNDPTIGSDLRSALNAALDALSAEYRAAVVLRDVEGLAIADVAAAMGIT